MNVVCWWFLTEILILMLQTLQNKTQFIPVVSFFFVSLYPGASEIERKLHQKLFSNYNMKVRPARYWEEKVMVRVGMTLSQLVSLVGTNPAVHNHWSVAAAASLSPRLSLNRTRRTKKWQPTFSWIWYLPTGCFPPLLHCFSSFLLSLFFSVALPPNGLVTSYKQAKIFSLVCLPHPLTRPFMSFVFSATDSACIVSGRNVSELR